jgi:hypothetical protein
VATSEDKPFDQAVCVHGYRVGDVRNVGSARRMAALRMARSRKARAARRACLKALEGVGETADAGQAAFRAAAEEAGILSAATCALRQSR